MNLSNEFLSPKEAGKFIAENSKDVSISSEGVHKTANIIFQGLKETDPVLHVKRWKLHELNPKEMSDAAIEWIFVSDLLNFSFWSDGPELSADKKFMVDYKGTKWTGYWAWCACLNRAIDEGIPLNDPSFYADISREKFQHILRSDTSYQMPMFEERLECLRQAGKRLVEDFGGKFVNVIMLANGNAQKLIELCVDNFPSFDDKADFAGKRVAIYKRVQILVADIWACFEGEGYGKFEDIDTITMFADYRIPQALVWFEVLQYSDRLLNLLKEKTMFKSGDREEVEIRGCTIEAVELIVAEVRNMLKQSNMESAIINAILVDHYMWDYRRENAAKTENIPIHRIRCMFY